MINIEQINADLRMKSDPDLQKYAMLNKNDPYIVSLALSEANTRKQIRTAAQAKMAGMPQPKVVDQDIAQMSAPQPQMPPQGMPQQAQQQLPENTGIGQLPAPNMQGMADGGIVGYSGKEGSVTRMSGADLFDKALDEEGITDPLRRAFAKAIHAQESSGKADAPTSNRGAAGPMQVRGAAWKDVATPDMSPKNPFDNMRAGIRYAMKGFDASNGNPVLAGAHYYGGPGGMKKLMEGKAVSDPENPKAPTTEGYGKSIADRMMKFLPVGSAEAATVEKAISSMPTTKAATAPAPAAGEDKRAWYDRYRDLMMSGEAQKAMLHGVQDVPAALLGAPVDISYAIANKLGRKEIAGEKPLMGSQYLKEKFGQMGVRAPESTNPDLQNIREATTGITTLYNPMSEAATAGKMTKAGIDTLRKENTAAAINAARTEAETTGALGAEARLVEEAEAARRAALSAEAPTKAAAIQKANEMAQASRAPVAKNLNPVGEAALLADAEIPLSADQQVAPAATATTAAPVNTPIDKEGIDKLLKEDKGAASAIAEKGGLAGLFKDPAFLMGMNLMASQNPRFLGGLGEAGMGTAKSLAELRRAEAEQGYYGARGAEAQATADLYNRGAKDRNMQLEAEKLVQKGMEDWAKSTAGKLGGINNPQAAQMEEARLRKVYYTQLGLPLVPLQSNPNAPTGSGFKLLGVRPQ